MSLFSNGGQYLNATIKLTVVILLLYLFLRFFVPEKYQVFYRHIFIEYDKIKEKFQQINEESRTKERMRVEKVGRSDKERG